MKPFHYERAQSIEAAIHAGAPASAKFLGGGTNLIDLMKDDVESPGTLVDINRLDMTKVEATGDGGIRIGALVRNSDCADHPLIREKYPLLSQALLSGASPQLRNMATTGGNLLQRTRCYYFMDTAFPACNKRVAGSGCAAIKGFNRIHAVLGASEECIATNPSDMNVAMAALDARVNVEGPKGKRTILFADFHRLPGNTPQLDTNLKQDELILSVDMGVPKFAANSYYLKVRDRNSYAFALVSVAVGLELSQGTIKSAGMALGGVAHKPWRSVEAEKALVGARPGDTSFTEAANKAAGLMMQGAKTYEHNAFKIELAKQSIVRALTLAAGTEQA